MLENEQTFEGIISEWLSQRISTETETGISKVEVP
jgi:hypothetical protein